MGDYTKRTERRLRKGVSAEKLLDRLARAERTAKSRVPEPDWHANVAKASEDYKSCDPKVRDNAQRLALNTAIGILRNNRAPSDFIAPLFDLMVSLDDHDQGLKVNRFISRTPANRPTDPSLVWIARSNLVGMVIARYRIDGKKSYPNACKAVIKDINKHLPDGMDVGTVMPSRKITDSAQMERWIAQLDKYRKSFAAGNAGQPRPNGKAGIAQQRYASMMFNFDTCEDDGSPEAAAHLQHLHDSYRRMALESIIQASKEDPGV